MRLNTLYCPVCDKLNEWCSGGILKDKRKGSMITGNSFIKIMKRTSTNTTIDNLNKKYIKKIKK